MIKHLTNLKQIHPASQDRMDHIQRSVLERKESPGHHELMAPLQQKRTGTMNADTRNVLAGTQRSPAAERMARSRDRRRQGYAFTVLIDVRNSEVDDLIRRKIISPEGRNDRNEVEAALRSLLDRAFDLGI